MPNENDLKTLEPLSISLPASIDKYNLLQKKIEVLITELEALKPLIIEMLEKEDGMKLKTPLGTTAKLTEKVNFKYLDEAAMIAWCEKNGHRKFVQKKLITSELNKELKKGMSLTEALKPLYTKTTSYSLTVADS